MTDDLRRLIERSWNDEQSDLEWGHLRGQRAEFGVKVRVMLPALLDVVEAARLLVKAQDEHGCATCGGTGVAWDWPDATALRAALERLDR